MMMMNVENNREALKMDELDQVNGGFFRPLILPTVKHEAGKATDGTAK